MLFLPLGRPQGKQVEACHVQNHFLMFVFRHVPKAKATIVADTPEMKRLASNTKIQSNVQYHAEFEANKAKFTSVTDDPESKRLAANSKVQSNISYHGLVEQKEQQEKKRTVKMKGGLRQGHKSNIQRPPHK